jgi:protein-S-isoprenylcysteine O-methyltransferase Ste14
MPTPSALSQTSLAAAIGLSAAGIWAGSQPPNPSPEKIPATGDSIRSIIVAQQKYGNILYLPLGVAALQQAALVMTYPRVPLSLLRYGLDNGLDRRLITWSRQTAIPLALILCVGTPLRLLSYGALGKNFTFALSEPDHLNTNGLYRYVQHPSYTGVLAMVVGVLGLWARLNGVLSCFVPPWLFSRLRPLEPGLLSLVLASIMAVCWKRVK